MDRTPYREAVRLLELAATEWSKIDAHYYQIDLLELPIYRQFNMIHSWFLSRMSTEEQVDMFESFLTDPFEWEKREVRAISVAGDDEIALMRAAAGE